MAKKYYYEDKSGYLKRHTRNSASALRTLAWISLLFYLSLGFLIIVAANQGNGMVIGITHRNSVGSTLIGVLIIFGGYISYAIISSIATLVENSDRSDLVNAIHELTDVIRSGDKAIDEKKYRKIVQEQALETLAKKVNELKENENAEIVVIEEESENEQ